MSEYVLVDEVIADLEDCSDTLSELGTSVGEGDFDDTVKTLDQVLQTLTEIRAYLAERDAVPAEDKTDD